MKTIYPYDRLHCSLGRLPGAYEGGEPEALLTVYGVRLNNDRGVTAKRGCMRVGIVARQYLVAEIRYVVLRCK